VQVEKFAAGVQELVGVFPERATLPYAASFGVTDSGKREADKFRELRLGKPGGAAAAGECPGKVALGVG
jgi:hypothetical protein